MERFQEERSQQDEEPPLLNPKRELKCALIKTSLKSFVVNTVSKYYQAAAIRVMIPHQSGTEVWHARLKLEERLNSEPRVVGFFSCGTCLCSYKKDDENKTIAGISFWIMFDWPEVGIEAFEGHLNRLALEVGLDTIHCKAVKGRGKIELFFLFKLCFEKMISFHPNEKIRNSEIRSTVDSL